MPIIVSRPFTLNQFIRALALGTLLALPCWGSAGPSPADGEQLKESRYSDSVAAVPDLARRRAACGFNCLYLLLRFSQQEIDTRQLERHLSISEIGNSFRSLKQASAQLGVPGTIVRAGVSDLQQFEMPLILLAHAHMIDELNEREMGSSVADFSQVGHYYVVTRATSEKIEVIDGTTGEYVVLPTSEISSDWIQAVFVPSRSFPAKLWSWFALTISLTLLTVFVHWRYQSGNGQNE